MKPLLKALWRILGPVRRPIERRFDSYLATHLRPAERKVTDDTNMLMDHVIRELVRLQEELDGLHERLESLQGQQAAQTRLDERHTAPFEQLKAG